MPTAAEGAASDTRARTPRTAPGPRRDWMRWTAAAAATAVVVTALATVNARLINVRAVAINPQNPYDQIAYVEARFRPGDVILVNDEASYAFAYYYTTPPGSYPASTVSANGFFPAYPNAPWIIALANRDQPAITDAVGQAVDMIAAEPPGHRGRVWVITDHVAPQEAGFWRNALAGGTATTVAFPKQDGQEPEPLLVYRPGDPPGRPGGPVGCLRRPVATDAVREHAWVGVPVSVQDADHQTAATPAALTGKRLSVALNSADVLLAIVAGAMVIVVHDVRYILTQPYWLDEAWVADSVRAPLSLVPRLASSTPLGWTLLLRLVPFSGHEWLRLVPLAFAALSVAAGYLLGRELRLTRFAAGLLTAAAVLLSPAMLARDDLKQYTAEAFAAIVIWLLVARLENVWSRWWLAALALVTSLGTLIAETAIFTGGAAFTCLFLAALIRRQWRRLAELAVAGAGALAIFGAIFVVVLKPRIDPRLSGYWAPLYSPTSVTGAARFFWTELTQRVGPYIGFPGAAPKAFTQSVTPSELVIPLAATVAGIVALALLGRYALAAMLPVTLLVVMTASAARQYPFGDERTSTFWEVLFPVLMAIAIATLIHGIGVGLRRLQPRARWALPVAAVVVGAAAIAGYAREVWPDVNSQLIAHDDSRSQIAYAEAHARPGDVYLVDFGASYGFAYYYRSPASAYPALPGNAAGFIPQYPGNPNVIIMTTRNDGDFAVAMRHAIADVHAEPAGARPGLGRPRAPVP